MALQQSTGKQSLTVSNSAVGFTLPAGIESEGAFMRLEGGPIRYWVDGSTPTSTVGTLLYDNETLTLTDRDAVAKFLGIRDSSAGADATVRATFFARYIH